MPSYIFVLGERGRHASEVVKYVNYGQVLSYRGYQRVGRQAYDPENRRGGAQRKRASGLVLIQKKHQMEG